MARRRGYEDRCGIARALDVVGERWALLLVRELLLGPKRYGDLQGGLGHISPDVLSQRLRGLEEAGILARRTLPPPASVPVYELTERGRSLEPVLVALGRWGAGTPLPEAAVPMSVDAHLVSLRTLFSPERAGDLRARIALDLGRDRARVRIADGTIAVERGEDPAADATIAAEPSVLLAVLRERRSLADAEAAGELRLDGDRDAAQRFLTLFPLPDPAPALAS
jgi:DNA-binding HxlR family transcriptional regulator/putative sterol carrier protein